MHGVATLGLQFTKAQTRALASRLRYAFIMFDSEPRAQLKAHELGEVLSFQGVQVEVIEIGGKDPGELPQKEADELKGVLFS